MDLVVVGRVGRPHGLRGDVTVAVSTEDPDDRFTPGAVLGTEGYYIDLTDTFDEARLETRQEVLDEALPDLFENRAAIEQAKGVLIAVYRVSADQAFRVLQWRSQETNVKLRALAKQIVREVVNLPPPSPTVQSQFDHVLLTVHERVRAESGQ